MRSEAAVLWETGAEWCVEEIELDAPRHGEVLVRIAASGICHSDAQLATGSLPAALPLIGGHEGAGVVEQVGPGVSSVSPGDHVVLGFIPACGRCGACLTGHSNLCETVSRRMGTGLQINDQTARHHARGRDLHLMCLLGTFSRHTVVHEAQCVKVDDDVPLDKAVLVSCAVSTGWGSAVYAAEVRPGDDVIVVGVGGVGVNAIQGARFAGAAQILAIDPVDRKRELAKNYGASHVAPGIDEALTVVRDITRGRGASKVIVTMDVGRGDLLAAIMRLASQRGRVVLVSNSPAGVQQVSLNLLDLTLREKQLVGTLNGSTNTHRDIPMLLDLYRGGHLELDSQITRTYRLSELNTGFDDLRAGRNIRGVVLS
jgi:NDMA-dependent alcohol dehydrogenase